MSALQSDWCGSAHIRFYLYQVLQKNTQFPYGRKNRL